MTSLKYKKADGQFFVQETEKCGAISPILTTHLKLWFSGQGKMQ